MARDYKKGVRDPSSHRTPEQIRAMDRGYNATETVQRHRVMQNAAHRLFERKGLVHKGQDVDHIKPLRSGGTNARKNLRAISQHRNRGWRDGV